jgi:hypothetical protein
MATGHFHIPGDATRREYAAYILVATDRATGERRVYVGKTGDNRAGCNPVISRAGNHFSFNKLHSQMRNVLTKDPAEYDFDYFYTTFGCYIAPHESRDGIDIVNEMERRLNRLARASFSGILLNPGKDAVRHSKVVRSAREAIATQERVAMLNELVGRVTDFLAKGPVPKH